MRALVPARLGADFTKLWTASAVSTIGDGVSMAAGPLLLASATTDPALVAGGAFASQLPWPLFCLISGAYADRLDRRRLVVAMNLLRGGALAVLAAAVAGHVATVAVIYIVLFLLGTGDTLANAASGALLPAIVAPERLPAANARLAATFTVGNQFAAKPLGAWLFVIAAAAPFGLDALSFVVAAALVARIRPIPAPIPESAPASGPGPEAPPRAALHRDIAEGIRWLWRHRLLRTLAVSMGVGNVAFCGAFAVFVLYARQRLGLSDVGYGLLLTTFAAGGLIGATVATRLEAAVGATTLLRVGLFIEAITHATLTLTRTPLVAAAILVIFGIHTMVWGIIVATVRQRSVPPHLLGRVGSAYALLDLGGAALGSLVGGLLAQAWSITTPFWIAAGVMTGVAVAAWRPLGRAAG